MKDRIITGIFLCYVAILAGGAVDQVFLDSMFFPPALDRQLLGMVDVLRDRRPATVAEARTQAEGIRQRLADIRLEREASKLEQDLAGYATVGETLEAFAALQEQARQAAIVNLVDNDEFSLGICIRALDPDLAMRLWVSGSDDLKVRQGCLEALKKISAHPEGFGYDPNGDPMARREAIRAWRNWRREFMEERRRPAPAGQLPQVQPPAVPPIAPVPSAAEPPAPKGGAIPGPGAP